MLYLLLISKQAAWALYKQPLGRRAWVLQERLMAEPTVSFGHGGPFGDCKQLTNASESFHHGIPENMRFPIIQTFESVVKWLLTRENLSGAWWEILNEYSQRELTRPTDRLIALSAVARSIGEAMEDVYIVGHFCIMLPQSLEWVVPPPGYHNRFSRTTHKITENTLISGRMTK